MADNHTTTQFLRSSMPFGKVIQTQSVLWPRA